jgi:aromatic ring-opening dioxygenase LigB subunit
VTINYKNPEDLENAIKERVKRLLNADVIDVTPLGVDLDEELGVYTEPELTGIAADLENGGESKRDS